LDTTAIKASFARSVYRARLRLNSENTSYYSVSLCADLNPASRMMRRRSSSVAQLVAMLLPQVRYMLLNESIR